MHMSDTHRPPAHPHVGLEKFLDLIKAGMGQLTAPQQVNRKGIEDTTLYFSKPPDDRFVAPKGAARKVRGFTRKGSLQP